LGGKKNVKGVSCHSSGKERETRGRKKTIGWVFLPFEREKRFVRPER